MVTATASATTDAYTELRQFVFSIAYRMVGSVGEAEDLVQEVFLRFHRQRPDDLRSAKAWLTTVTTRLAITHLTSARARRETYVGTWLPEPLLTSGGGDAVERVEMEESLSIAFLVLLERLSPVERAVFILREAFDLPFDEIAGVVDKSEENVRQIAVRARRRVEADRPRFEPSPARREELARRFFRATDDGDLDELIELLAEDVVAHGDGGGAGRATLRPVRGRDRLVQLMSGRDRWLQRLGVADGRPVEINGHPGALFTDAEGRVVLVIALDVVADGAGGDRVAAVWAISNPAKLSHLEVGLPSGS